jgi:hypothetical protein
MTEALPGLRCVIAWSDRRSLCSIIGDQLRTMAPEAELRRLGDDAHIVYTSLTADELRDRLRAHLAEDEGLLVVDFEAWSGYGKALDASWLLARGH